MDTQKRKITVAFLSIVSNTTLTILKLVTGLFIGSVSIISEAIHSGVDLLASLIAFAAVKTAGKPADRNHPFGHGKIENISGAIEAVLIFVAAGWIIYEAVKKLIHPAHVEFLGWGVAIMFVSSIVNWLVSGRLFKVGRETESIALQADAWHLRTDVYTSLGVMVGLAIMWVGKRAFPGTHLHWIDPVIAIAVALVIIRTAYDLTVESLRDLMDTNLPPEEEAYIRSLIESMTPEVHGYHKLRTRKAGSHRFIEFHMKVDPQMTVKESHRITHEIKRQVVEQFPHASLSIHVEPCDGCCSQECRERCLLTDDARRRIQKARSKNTQHVS